jgi:hypothetical protein
MKLLPLPSIKQKHILIFSLLLLFVLALGIWRLDSPYPSVLGWDIYAHQTLFYAMSKHGLHVLPSELSDTFLLNAYFPVFALLIGIFQPVLSVISLPGYFFLLDSLHFLSTIFITAFLAWVITKDYLAAGIAGVFSAFSYEAIVAQTSLFAIPQNIAATFVTLSLVWWLQNHRNRAQLVLFPTMLLHFVIGGFGWAVLGITWVTQTLTNYLQKRSKSLNWLLLGSVVGVVLAVVISMWLTLNPLGTSESVEFVFSLQDKYFYLLRTYSYTWLFFLIGIWQVMRTQSSTKITLAVIALLLLAAVILPLPYSLKFYTVARYPIHVIMAIGVVAILYQYRWVTVRAALVLVLVATQAVIFFYNQTTFKQALAYGTVRTTASEYDWQAAQVLRTTYYNRHDVLLVSDPATQHVLEGLSGINTQGGAFAMHQTREVVDSAFPLEDPEVLKEKLFEIRDLVDPTEPAIILFAVSGRFMNWQHLEERFRYDEGYNIWSARDLTPEGREFAQQLGEQEGFKQVFANPSMVIFEIHR